MARPSFCVSVLIRHLFEWVLEAFGVEVRTHSEIQRHRAFVQFIEKQRQQGRRVVLFVDEAQNLSPSVLEELLTLTNVNVDYPSFRVVLSGQHALRDCLSRPDARQSARSIAVTHRLRRLDAAGTEDYIRHRLQTAGGDPYLFDSEACRLDPSIQPGLAAADQRPLLTPAWNAAMRADVR